MRHNKQKIYFKNIYKTDLCDCLKRNAKGTHLHVYVYSRWVYKQGGWAYIRNNYSLAKGWAHIQGGLKTKGALKWDFMVFLFKQLLCNPNTGTPHKIKLEFAEH